MSLFIILLIGYFIPTAIAIVRKHKDTPAIAAINILLGWSVVGWFISFIWALSDPTGRGGTQTVVINNTTQHNVAVAPLRQDESLSPRPGLPPARGPAPSRPAISSPVREIAVDPDTAFWDGMGDKNDPDLLEEYLIRFPSGRFAQLAQNKLERSRVLAKDTKEPISSQANAIDLVTSSPLPPISASCKGCEAPLEPGSKFCTDCGSPVPS